MNHKDILLKISVNRILIFQLLILLFFAVGCKEGNKRKSASPFGQPNMVVVLVDDLRWDEYG